MSALASAPLPVLAFLLVSAVALGACAVIMLIGHVTIMVRDWKRWKKKP